MPKKATEVVSEKLGNGAVFPVNEIGTGQSIETITDPVLRKIAQEESFANDVLTIRVHQDNLEGSLPVICPGVNGMNQPIIRGKESKVKRKYVEALARCRTTQYIQKTPDPTRPESIQMEERTVVSYPFAVLHDPHPKGSAWLEGIIAQP